MASSLIEWTFRSIRFTIFMFTSFYHFSMGVYPQIRGRFQNFSKIAPSFPIRQALTVTKPIKGLHHGRTVYVFPILSVCTASISAVRIINRIGSRSTFPGSFLAEAQVAKAGVMTEE